MPPLSEALTMLEDLEYEVGPVEPHLAAYCQHLRSTVADRFRLRLNREPAWWALEAVHDHVTSGNAPEHPVGVAYGEFLFGRDLRLTIHVTDDGATITATDHFGEEARKHLHSPGALSFQDWEKLELAAVDMLRRQIEVTRLEFEADYQRVGTGRDQRRRIDADLEAIPVLVDRLLTTPRNRTRLDETMRKRLAAIRQMIVIDSPEKNS
jgi:hypothetical protein